MLTTSRQHQRTWERRTSGVKLVKGPLEVIVKFCNEITIPDPDGLILISQLHRYHKKLTLKDVEVRGRRQASGSKSACRNGSANCLEKDRGRCISEVCDALILMKYNSTKNVNSTRRL